MVLEYLSGNEIIRYPFKDDCSVVSTTNGITLPMSVFADMLVGFKTNQLTSAGIIGLVKSGNTASVHLAVYDNTGAQVRWESLDVDLSLANTHTLFAFSFDAFIVKLVIGSGFYNFFNELPSDVVEEYNLPLAISATQQHVPRVTSISFINAGDNLEAFVYGDETSPQELNLLAGSNISLSEEKNKLVISVLPGSGTGLHNPCGDDLVIKSINETPGDPFLHNFTFVTDDCYTVSRGYGTHHDNGLIIENICTPKCTAEQFAAFAHYNNRVKDGMLGLATRANFILNELQTEITNYNNVILPASKLPFIKSAVSSYDNGYGTVYHSLVVAFFNRSDSEAVNIASTITLSSGASIVSSRYKNGDINHVYEPTNHFSQSLPCLEYGRFEVVIKGSTFTVGATAGTVTYTKSYSL
jgi:hypothetical protein